MRDRKIERGREGGRERERFGSMMVHFDNKKKCNFWKRRKKVEIEILEIGEIFCQKFFEIFKFVMVSRYVPTYVHLFQLSATK